MKDEYIHKVIDDATAHDADSYNSIETRKLIRRLLSVVCYQKAQLDMLKRKPIRNMGPR